MGVYDRDYYSESGASFLANQARVCTALIVSCVALFLVQMLVPATAQLLALDSSEVRNFQIWRLLTFVFVHDPTQPWTLAINMIALFLFGREIEAIHGGREFFLFYMLASLTCGIVFLGASLAGLSGSAMGATGPVMAVLALCAVRNPRQVVYLVFIPVTMWSMLMLFVALDVLSMLKIIQFGSSLGLVGIVFGLIYYRADFRLEELLPSSRRQRVNRPQLRIFRAEEEQQPVLVGTQPKVDLDEQLEAKLDEVLDKLNQLGQNSLTDKEKQILLRASEVYRKRRE